MGIGTCLCLTVDRVVVARVTPSVVVIGVRVIPIRSLGMVSIVPVNVDGLDGHDARSTTGSQWWQLRWHWQQRAVAIVVVGIVTMLVRDGRSHCFQLDIGNLVHKRFICIRQRYWTVAFL